MTPTITAGLVISVLTLGGSSIAAYTSVKTDIQKTATSVEKIEEYNRERFDDLKDDTKEIRDLLNKLLLQKKAEDG
jgi:hypothetical protein